MSLRFELAVVDVIGLQELSMRVAPVRIVELRARRIVDDLLQLRPAGVAAVDLLAPVACLRVEREEETARDQTDLP